MQPKMHFWWTKVFAISLTSCNKNLLFDFWCWDRNYISSCERSKEPREWEKETKKERIEKENETTFRLFYFCSSNTRHSEPQLVCYLPNSLFVECRIWMYVLRKMIIAFMFRQNEEIFGSLCDQHNDVNSTTTTATKTELKSLWLK